MTSRIRGRILAFAVGIWLVLNATAFAEDQKPAHSAVKPVAKKDAFWTKRHEAFVERAKKGDVDVLFLGDSITHGWDGGGKDVWKERLEPLKAANFGIGGDRTEHVLWRLTEGKELEGIQPKAFVLMIGTNNMGSNTAQEIAEGIHAIIHTIRHQRPHAKVLLLGIFPRSPKPTEAVRDKINYVNEKIAKFDDSKHVRYLNIGGKFLDEHGNLPKDIMNDYLHLTPAGYKIWADAILPPLEEMLKQ